MKKWVFLSVAAGSWFTASSIWDVGVSKQNVSDSSLHGYSKHD
jgi:hypothetical protein